MKIVADSHISFVENYFADVADLTLIPGRSIQPADVRDADILLVRSITKVNEQLLHGSSVKFVGSVTGGADHLDTHWLEATGIDYSIAAGFNAPAVADYVVSTLAAIQKKRILLPDSAENKLRAIVIGVGHVGRLVVDRLTRLDFDVSVCDPLRAAAESDFHSITFDAIADYDLISLHVPLTTAGDYPTYHCVDKNFLARQKPGAVLLNASRGAVIKSEDLLKYGTHLHWCFDVWEHEPTISRSILRRAVIATPHIAGYSVQSKLRGIEQIYRSICKKNLLTEHSHEALTGARQQLSIAGRRHRWQDVMMNIFNPFAVTAMMRTLLLPNEDKNGRLFDEMRNQFNYRFEFDHTDVLKVKIDPADQAVLEKLGLRFLTRR